MLPLYNKTFEHRLDGWESSSTDYIAWLSCVTFISNTWAIHEAGQFAWSRVKKLYTTDTLPFAPGFYPTVAILHSLEKTVHCRSNRFAGKETDSCAEDAHDRRITLAGNARGRESFIRLTHTACTGWRRRKLLSEFTALEQSNRIDITPHQNFVLKECHAN